MEIQFSKYKIIKFCKLAPIKYSRESEFSKILFALKNQIKTIIIKCQNLATTQTKT